MALKPQEIRNLTPAELTEVERLETVIDGNLPLRFDHSARLARFILTTSSKILFALYDRYEYAGWKVKANKITDDQWEFDLSY